MIKQGDLYDDVQLGVGGRDLREPVGIRHGGGGGAGAGGTGHDTDKYSAAGIDAALEHIINSRAMRGEYDLPLELMLPDGAAKGGCGGAVPGPQ